MDKEKKVLVSNLSKILNSKGHDPKKNIFFNFRALHEELDKAVLKYKREASYKAINSEKELSKTILTS